MTVGDKIKKIRTFRGMTQKELGLAVGFEEKGADNRIAQYETNYRVPKRELLDKICGGAAGRPPEFLHHSPRLRRGFSCGHSSGSTRTAPALSACSNLSAIRAGRGPLMIPPYGTMNGDDWPAHPPVGMYFQYGLVDEFMREWLLRQQELHAGEITRDEYFEWKLNWPPYLRRQQGKRVLYPLAEK